MCDILPVYNPHNPQPVFASLYSILSLKIIKISYYTYLSKGMVKTGKMHYRFQNFHSFPHPPSTCLALISNLCSDDSRMTRFGLQLIWCLAAIMMIPKWDCEIWLVCLLDISSSTACLVHMFLSTVSNISKSFGINQKLDLTYVTHLTTIKGHCHPGLDIVDL